LSDSEIINEWPSDYYFIPDNVPEPAHILSVFYRVYIWCELRLAVFFMLHKQSESSIPVEVLRYELITLLDSWLDLLMESQHRLRFSIDQGMKEQLSTEFRIVELQRYLWKRLILNLETSIYELQDRFSLIPEDRRLTRRDLYLKQFEQPVPDTIPIVPTLARTQHQLQHHIHKEDALVHLDFLMNEIQSEMSQQTGEELRNVLSKSLNLLQNARLCTGMRSSKNEDTDKTETPFLDAEANRDHLSNLIRILQKGRDPSDKEKEGLHYIMQSISEYRAHFAISEHKRPALESEAVQLVRMIDSHFGEPNSTVSSKTTNRQTHTQSARKNLLDRYMDLDVIRQKIDVTHKTMKKYLEESGVEVIEFSQQRQLIHEDEVEKFLDYHKKKK
jgi:hypothetical protein